MVKLEQQAEEALKANIEKAFRKAMEREAAHQQPVHPDFPEVAPNLEAWLDPPVVPVIQGNLVVLEIRHIAVDVQDEKGDGGSVVFVSQEGAPLRVAVPTTSVGPHSETPARSLWWGDFLVMTQAIVRGVRSSYNRPVINTEMNFDIGDVFVSPPDEQGE